MIKFNCDACGSCCRNLKKILEDNLALKPTTRNKRRAQRQYKKFPYDYLEDGSCEMLVDNKCSVYNNRPTVCSVEKMSRYYPELSKREFFTAMEMNCVIFKANDDENRRSKT